MRISGLKCPYCGAEIAVKADRKYIKCAYCKSSLYIDHETLCAAPIEDETKHDAAMDQIREIKGQQEPDEERRAPETGYETEAPENTEHEDTAPIREEPERSSLSGAVSAPAEKARSGLGKIILWIVFFPFMLTAWIFKRKNVPVLIRWMGIFLIWGALFWLVRECCITGKKGTAIDEIAETPVTEQAAWETEPETVKETDTEIIPALTEKLTERQTQKKEEGRRATYMEGRGRSDSGRMPDYTGVIGYAVTGYTENLILERRDICFDTPWQVPIYEKDKQFFEKAGTIDHKTEVLVLSQDLKHEGRGRYSGYLTVRELKSDREYLLDVTNFITKPYWVETDLIEAAKTGNFLAKYHPVSDYYPVTKSNEKVELEDGFTVLVRGLTGTFWKGGPDRDITQLECVVFKEWKYGYGDVIVYFNKDDLELIY